MIFTGDNREYFVDRMQQMIALGVDMAGGGCGTTPEYISDLAGKLDFTQYPQTQEKAEPEKKLPQRITLFTIKRKRKAGRN